MIVPLGQWLENLGSPWTLIPKILGNAATHPLTVAEKILNTIQAFSNEDYRTAGEEMGSLLNILTQ